jgi:hypothetical protein
MKVRIKLVLKYEECRKTFAALGVLKTRRYDDSK